MSSAKDQKSRGRVYFTAAVTFLPEDQRQAKFERYKRIGEMCSRLNFRVHVAPLADDPQRAIRFTPGDPNLFQVVNDNELNTADIVIADGSVLSSGVAMDVESSQSRGRPVLLIAEKGTTLSPRLLNAPAVRATLFFRSEAELEQWLIVELNKLFEPDIERPRFSYDPKRPLVDSADST